MADTQIIETIAEVLGATVSRHACVRDSMDVWLRDDEPLQDHLGVSFTVAAALHPGDARDAARDLLDRMAANGLTVRRAVPAGGNSLGARLLRLATEISTAGGQVSRIRALAEQLAALAEEAAQRDEAVIPAHLRVAASDASDGVVRLCDRRRA